MHYNIPIDNDFAKSELILDECEIRRVIDLQLMLSDYIQIDISDKALLQYNMIKFNLSYNIKSLLSRTWYIFCHIAISQEIIAKYRTVYTDFNQKFHTKHNFKISDYLATYFYLFVPFIGDSICNKVLIDPSHHFDNSPNPEICNQIVGDLFCTQDNYRNYSKETIGNTWDYEILTEYPILQFNSGNSTVISDQHLQENVVENLIEKIKDTYENGRENDFKQFLGHLFEEYVQNLCFSSTTKSKQYAFINEFKIDKNNRSSDAYILKGKNMLIVEVKAKTLTRSKLFKDLNTENIKCKIKEQFILPTQQIDDRYEDIKKSKKYSRMFDEVTEIYSIIVNFESCHLSVPEYHEYAIEGIKKESFNGKKHIRTQEMKYFFSLGIEEFECVCWLIENGYDIFQILKNYYSCSNKYHFYNFLEKEGIKFDVVSIMVRDNWNLTQNSFFEFFQIK